MKTKLAVCLITALIAPTASIAGPGGNLLAQYAAAAKQSFPAFSGFSASRGEKLHVTKHTGGKPGTPACTSCHADHPRSPGRTPAGKTIDPVALSASPTRYSDPAKIEKWFRRNCNEVLGRECTPLEKGDWLTYMIGQ